MAAIVPSARLLSLTLIKVIPSAVSSGISSHTTEVAPFSIAVQYIYACRSECRELQQKISGSHNTESTVILLTSCSMSPLTSSSPTLYNISFSVFKISYYMLRVSLIQFFHQYLLPVPESDLPQFRNHEARSLSLAFQEYMLHRGHSYQ